MFFCLIIGLASFTILWLIGLGHFFNKRALPPDSADAALVFGTGVVWKALSRSTTAAQLFQQGRVRHLIVSGGVKVPDTNLSEAEWFQSHLLAQGVPAERILLETQATNTAENAALALPIIRQHNFKTVILVMSDFDGTNLSFPTYILNTVGKQE